MASELKSKLESESKSESETIIRKMRREGDTWSEVCDWITRNIGYNSEVIEWARKIYNDECRP